VEERFSQDRMVENYLAVYRQIIGKMINGAAVFSKREEDVSYAKTGINY
jgi:hypothetical protein